MICMIGNRDGPVRLAGRILSSVHMENFSPGLYVIACTKILAHDFLCSNSENYVVITHSTSRNHFCNTKSPENMPI